MRHLAPVFLLLASLASPVTAQDRGRSEVVTGRWEACFRLDSVSAGGIAEACGVLTFTTDSACGVAILDYNIPLDSLFVDQPYSRTMTVGYRFAADTVHFGGRIAKGTQPGSCRIYGDDGALYGTATLVQGELIGEWGVSSYFDNGPIGHLVMKRGRTQ